MGILSPIIEFIVEKEHSFPAPSEKEKLARAIKRYQLVLTRYPQRLDIGEIKFGLADMYVGHGGEGDYDRAQRLYVDILNSGPPDYLKARALIGKAELVLPRGKNKEIPEAIEALDRARKLLENDLTDFFTCKAIVVEADLLLVRAAKGDRDRAYKLCTDLIKNKAANWYFKARAYLDKAEIILYTRPKEIKDGTKLCLETMKLLAERTDDYFYIKSKIIMAELRIGLGGKQDIFLAHKYLGEVIKAKTNYQDLVARAKLILASIATPQQAKKLATSVMETEALDPYLLEMAKQVADKLKEPQKKKK